RRGWRSISPLPQMDSARIHRTSTRETCERSDWGSPGAARELCSTSQRWSSTTPRATAAAATTASESATAFAEPKATGEGHAVRDIDFRRGRNGEAQIIVDLSDATTG